MTYEFSKGFINGLDFHQHLDLQFPEKERMGDSDSENEGSQTNVNRLVIRPPGHTGDINDISRLSADQLKLCPNLSNTSKSNQTAKHQICHYQQQHQINWEPNVQLIHPTFYVWQQLCYIQLLEYVIPPPPPPPAPPPPKSPLL